MPIDFKRLLQTLQEGITKLAAKELKDDVATATPVGLAILKELQDGLERWTMELADGQISKGDFADLVLGQKDELIALKHAGLAEIAADRFKRIRPT